MIDIEIDGCSLHVAQNTTIIEVADQAGIYIPRFCYHKKLSIAANCRMCLVEVEKSGKPLPACATPVTAGMKVFTTSPKAKEAQRAVMEFLLINHPLDCPICDQGGECELQDLSLGYGQSISRFTEGKRSVQDDNLGSLIASDMTRCIQCTRCVRFGQEVAGIKELGALNRGEDLQISTYIKHSLASELSGNIIDLCPVGALTSKPFRFKARAWELQQSASIAPHDCLGSNIYLHTRREQLLRVVPRENEAINETWLSDRDRYSYLAVHSDERVTQPHIKENGQWFSVDWQTALEKVVHGFKQVLQMQGPQAMGALLSASSTTEECYLLQKLWRGLGCQHIDHRLHQTDTSDQAQAPLYALGKALTEMEQQEFILLLGANVRREQPLVVHRLRKAHFAGAQIASVHCLDITAPFKFSEKIVVSPHELVIVLASLAKALSSDALPASLANIQVTPQQRKLAKQLKNKKSLLILGATAHNHPHAALIRQLSHYIAEQSGAQCVHLTEGANSAGAWLAGAIPHRQAGGKPVSEPGLSAQAMFNAVLKAYFLVNIEPTLDCANPMQVRKALQQADWVVALSPFKSKSLLAHAHVILPMASFAETAGSYLNIAGDWQPFQAAMPPLGQAKPGWEILQTLGNLFALPDFNSATHDFIHDELQPYLKKQDATLPSSTLPDDIKLPSYSTAKITRITEWPLYWVDSLLRRSPALQSAASNDNVGIAMNATLAATLQLKEQQIVRVQQGEGRASLAVLISEHVPDNCVWIPAACEETANLGESFAAVEIYAE
jgi:NADH-quinone oxidoreductase subunit G